MNMQSSLVDNFKSNNYLEDSEVLTKNTQSNPLQSDTCPNVIVKPINKKVLSKVKIIQQGLKTHPKLNNDDISYTILAISEVGLLDNIKQLAIFITHINTQTYTGRFSFLYNLDLDYNIKQRNKERIQLLSFVESINAFPEFFDNSMLDDEQKDTIQKQYRREIVTSYNTIQESGLSSNQDAHNENFLYPCQYTLEGHILETNQARTGISLYNKCYKEICIFEQDITDENIELHDESGIVNQTLLIPDNSNNNDMYNIKCYTLIELLDKLYKTLYQKSTYPSNLILSSEASNLALKRFKKELLMYRYYQEKLQQNL